jgi:hypothetical protein
MDIDDIEFGDSEEPEERPAREPLMVTFRQRAPQEFYEELRAKLARKGVDLSKVPHLSDIDNPPACFRHAYRDYPEDALMHAWHEWLGCAVGTDLPYRFDMPGEPNYCRDCPVKFKMEAHAAGQCSFPSVRYEVVESFGEKETVGVSRAPEVRPAGMYFADKLVVPFDANLWPELTPEMERLRLADKGEGRVWV